jgi:hypothetical protein
MLKLLGWLTLAGLAVPASPSLKANSITRPDAIVMPGELAAQAPETLISGSPGDYFSNSAGFHVPDPIVDDDPFLRAGTSAGIPFDSLGSEPSAVRAPLSVAEPANMVLTITGLAFLWLLIEILNDGERFSPYRSQ